MLYIAIDGGGKGSRLAVFNEEGNTVHFAKGGALNPNFSGVERAISTLRTLLHPVSIEVIDQEIAAVFGGISGIASSGFASYYEQVTSQYFPNAKVKMETDGITALASGGAIGDGAVLMAGTGVAGFISHEGEIYKMAGNGYLLDRGGSGWHIGRDGLVACLLAHEGRGGRTSLEEKYSNAVGMSIEHFTGALYRDEIAVATHAPLVFEAALEGDVVANEILERNARYLAGLATDLAIMHGGPRAVVTSGGLLERSPGILPYLERALDGTVELIRPLGTPLLGGALLAMKLCDKTPQGEFIENFNRTSVEQKGKGN